MVIRYGIIIVGRINKTLAYQEHLGFLKKMNSTFKFHTDENFDYTSFIAKKAAEAVEEGVKSLSRKGEKITEQEKKLLTGKVLKNMTVHIYTSGRFAMKDLYSIRPKTEKTEEKKEVKSEEKAK